MNLHLVDTNYSVVEAWRKHFANFTEVEIYHGNILEIADHCIVSPANSHGYMDGGIDEYYRDFFGMKLEQAVQERILQRPEQMLPVGAAVVVPTGNRKIPYMVIAPTMEMPEAVPAVNAARAMGAILRMVKTRQLPDGNIYCPGLCTLTGKVEPDDAAREMALAYSSWKAREA